MICRDKIIFSCLIACGLGAAGGYLFSSRFCKVTIVKRVAKEIALNQTLRQLFTERAFWTRDSIRSVFLNSPDQTAIAARLSKNSEELANILKAYYGATTSDKFKNLIRENTNLINQIVTAKKENQSVTTVINAWTQNNNEITTMLSQLNPAWQSGKLETGFDNQLSYITQEIEALQTNNWSGEVEIFDKHLEDTLQIADEFDKGITTQFPEKF